jgi:hypothetical protein
VVAGHGPSTNNNRLAERGWRPAHLAAVAVHQPGTSSGILQAMPGLSWVLRERRPVPGELEAALRTLAP